MRDQRESEVCDCRSQRRTYKYGQVVCAHECESASLVKAVELEPNQLAHDADVMNMLVEMYCCVCCCATPVWVFVSYL